jgi:hypothetical protein
MTLTHERRRFLRHVVSLDVLWDGSSAFAPSRLSDISLGGCYVDSRSTPNLGETVELTVTIDGVSTVLRGTVTQVHLGMGFGVAFSADPGVAQHVRAFLSSLPT